jgi:hypothetical protein
MKLRSGASFGALDMPLNEDWAGFDPSGRLPENAMRCLAVAAVLGAALAGQS